MNEVEYRAERARYYYKLIVRDDIDTQIVWCILLGLWETSGWISDNAAGPIFKWLEPDVRI